VREDRRQDAAAREEEEGLSRAPGPRMRPPVGVGIGLRAPHYRAFLDASPATDWLEVHSENYFGAGGFDLHVLDRVRERYPVSLHGVGLALGSVDDTVAAQARFERHLDRLARLVDRIQPALVSEHLAWGALGARHYNDLLPLPRTAEAIAHVTGRIERAQERLRRPILVENIATYVAFADDAVGEAEFVGEAARRSGCGVLLDLNNVYVNAVNHGFDALAVIDAMPAATVQELHLAGHASAGDVLIDDHGSRVAPPVWTLYERALERFGAVPTLIEWDTNVPALDVLVAEADAARRRMREAVASHA
jgi:uncharacterized protein (UPF0276 family)